MQLEEDSASISLRSSEILSAEDLFRWRKKENLTVPQRGGIKDYEPDDSWLQDKRLEAFYQEHLTVLAEPRVEKSGNLVKGTWNPELKLVDIEKTAKFWMKMGFADQHRNWLHPEEALFLMEVNCLVVQHQGLSLSLQEAYHLLLHPSCGITEKEYQVYAHLRRLGFIIIRHAGKHDITKYEREIRLDKHVKKRNKKKSKKGKGSEVDNLKEISQANSDEGFNEQSEDAQVEASAVNESDRTVEEQGKGLRGNAPTEANDVGCDTVTHPLAGERSACGNDNDLQDHSPSCLNETGCHSKRKLEKGDTVCSISGSSGIAPEASPSKRARVDKYDDSQKDILIAAANQDAENGNDNSISANRSSGQQCDAWTEATRLSLASRGSAVELSSWDFSQVPFPDIGGKGSVAMSLPPPHLLPPNTCVDEDYEDVCMFDAEDYRRQQELTRKQEEGFKQLKDFEFSYAEWCQRHYKPSRAVNWKQWKEEACEREKTLAAESPVAHLWQGDVVPLVRPTDATSTASLLERLSVIQPFKGPFPQEQGTEGVKISFDVYLPNTTFKKSSPGLPDHRVCVARGENPPDLFDVHAVCAALDDGIPLHWAVVNCGEISFFVFDDHDLPVLPSSLG